jgi:DHA1 family multidrug resistance protein-like MFS transporter
MLWLSAPVSFVLFFFLPETSSATILYRRAKRLQRITGNLNYKSQSEIDQANLTVGQIVNDALIKPAQINALDPAVLFSTFYTGLVYGIYYSFFECFPIVYTQFYHFGFAVSSLPFLSVLIGLMISGPAYAAYWYWGVDKQVQRKGLAALGVAEDRLVPALFLCILIPGGLFLFGTYLFSYGNNEHILTDS